MKGSSAIPLRPSSFPNTVFIHSWNTFPLQVSPNGSLFHLYFVHRVLTVQSLLLLSSMFYLPKPATTGFGYGIIYGSHMVWDALHCFVQVTGVQEKANCAVWLSGNHSRVNPRRDSLCACSRISTCRSRW